jgi:WD40 repeat protein
MPYIDGAALDHVVRAVWDTKTAQPGSKTPTLVELAGKLARPSAEESVPVSMCSVPTTPNPIPAGRSPTVQLTLSVEYFRSVAQALADVAEAVHHAHGAGIIHRDLKPSNVMVDRGGHCWVIDFGVAGYLSARDDEAKSADASVPSDPAAASGVMGTPNYMAPEQFDSKADVRSDVWGLGVTLYELLTLRRAFTGEDFAEVRANVLEGRRARIEELTANVPPDLTAICRKALQKEPSARYATAQAFADDLRRWLRFEPTKARGAPLHRRMWLWGRRNPGWAAAALFSIVAGLMGVLVFVYGLRAETVAAEAESAQLARKKAESEAARAKQEKFSEAFSNELRLLRQSGVPFGLPIGWSARRLELVRDYYKDRPEDDQRRGRGEAGATLAGLDAVTDKKMEQHAGSLAFSRDGKRLVLGGVPRIGNTPAVKGGVYDRAADRLTPSEQPGEAIDGPVAFTADGTPLQLTAKDAYTLRLWDVDRQRTVREFVFAEKLPATKLDAENQPALAISEDGILVAASTKLPDGKRVLVVWEAATGKEIGREAEKAKVKEEVLAFSTDNSLLATGDNSGTIIIRPLKQFDKEMSLPAGRLSIHSLAFARDPVRRHKDGREASGWLLAAGETGGAITIWDVERKIPRSQFPGSNYDVYCLTFSPDGSLLASAGRGAPRVWDVATGRLLLTLHGGNTFPGIAFSPDGQFLAVSALPLFGSPGGVEVYALDYGRGIRTLRGLRGQVAMTCLSPDERYLAALTQDWQVGVWDYKTGRLLHVFEAPVGPWSDNAALALSNDGRLACASWRGAILWDVVRGQELRRWEDLPPGRVNLLGFHPSGKLLLFREETEDMRHSPDSSAHPRDYPRVCRIRDLLAKDPATTTIALRDLNWYVSEVVCPADGSYFVANGLRKTGDKRESHLIVYDGLTGKVLWDLPYGGEHEVVPKLDPTGKLLGFHLPGQTQMTLVEMPTGKTHGFNPPAGLIGPEAEWWLPLQPSQDSSGQEFGLSLHRRGTERSLVTLAPNNMPSGTNGALFNVAGTHLAWGNADGTVTVCDIQEIRRRLAAVGLGW